MSAVDNDWSSPQHLRLMWDYSAWPLWREDGGDCDDPEYLQTVLSLTPSLIQALRAWASEAEALLGSEADLDRPERDQQLDALDGWAEKLVKRLSAELPADIPVRYQR